MKPGDSVGDATTTVTLLAGIIEVSGQPERLDLNGWHYKLAKDIGMKLALSTDAHSTTELGFMAMQSIMLGAAGSSPTM